METLLTILGIALILFAFIGVLVMFALLGAILLVKNGAMLTFGYEQDDADNQ